MIDTGYLYSSNSSRLFVNTCLGCKGGCTYCYLPSIGYNNTENANEVMSSERILKQLIESDFELTEETLISFGCFSECWDENNVSETKKLIEYFLKKGNQVQLSTKKEISLKDIKSFEKYVKYYGQLIIFVSTSTISRWNELEPNTEMPNKRFLTFKNLKVSKIVTILYIKPVLENITIKDIDIYKDIIIKFDIKDVVVGSIFTGEENKDIASFSNNKLFYKKSLDEEIIIDKLKNICSVFSRSTDAVKKYKNSL